MSSLPKSLACLKGIMAGFWIDVQGSWARAVGVDTAITCKRDWACTVGTRRDFLVGCPLAATALEKCWVDGCRGIQPHFLSVLPFRLRVGPPKSSSLSLFLLFGLLLGFLK